MLVGFIGVLLTIVCIALIGLILIQKGKGGGLAGVFGGGGVEQAFGTHATTMAQKATAVLGALFLLLTVILTISMSSGSRYESSSPVQSLPGPSEQTAPSSESPAAPASTSTESSAPASAPASSAPAAPEAPAAPAGESK